MRSLESDARKTLVTSLQDKAPVLVYVAGFLPGAVEGELVRNATLRKYAKTAIDNPTRYNTR